MTPITQDNAKALFLSGLNLYYRVYSYSRPHDVGPYRPFCLAPRNLSQWGAIQEGFDTMFDPDPKHNGGYQGSRYIGYYIDTTPYALQD